MGCLCKQSQEVQHSVIVPPTIQAALNGAVSIAKNKLGIGVANSITKSKRLDICNQCDQLNKGIVDQCKLCGCVIREKVARQDETCPSGKW